MRLEKVSIKNYRSFDNEGIEIEFPDIQLPFSIVGHNNSGKSNFINSVLYGLSVKSVGDTTFDVEDFHFKDTSKPISVKIQVNPPLQSADAYNRISEMPIFQLNVKQNEGVFEVSHYCCDTEGKPVYNPRTVKRSKTKKFTKEELDVLKETQKQGAETVFRWKSKIPVYYINCSNIHYQLRINRNTLLGKVMLEVKRDFESQENVVKETQGVIPTHVGKPRVSIFENALRYIESHVLSTENLDRIISRIEKIIKKQLELDSENFSLKFGLPSADSFFNNLTFYLTDNPNKPQLPIDYMGDGFVSLFVVALFRALINSDEGGNIFIIEEPETFLHEHFQEYFYLVLCELAKNNQVIYTTHSKKFANLFEPKSIIKFKNPENVSSRLFYKTEPTIEYPDEIDDFKIESPAQFPKYLRTLEPNLGNIIFASKVLIVEGPHDLLAYKTVFENRINFGLNNIAIVAAWGKDSLITIIQLCKRYEIPYFVVHDWDLDDYAMDISKPPDSPASNYASLPSEEKAQYTKNFKILQEAGSANVHHNKKNLETVLGITKSPVNIFNVLNGKSLEEVSKECPNFISRNILDFLSINNENGN